MANYKVTFEMDIPAGYEPWLFSRNTTNDTQWYLNIVGPLGPAAVSNVTMEAVVTP